MLRSSGGLVVSAYAEDDTHPVKQVVEHACDLQARGVHALRTAHRAHGELALEALLGGRDGIRR